MLFPPFFIFQLLSLWLLLLSELAVPFHVICFPPFNSKNDGKTSNKSKTTAKTLIIFHPPGQAKPCFPFLIRTNKCREGNSFKNGHAEGAHLKLCHWAGLVQGVAPGGSLSASPQGQCPLVTGALGREGILKLLGCC